MTRAILRWAVLSILAFVSTRHQPARHVGYGDAAFAREAAVERRFRDNVSADRMREAHAMVTRRPHLAGTEGARVVADSIRRMLQRDGLEVEVSEYRAYLSTPKEIAIDLVAPTAEHLRVTEPASALDPDTSNPELGPGYVAYSASGDVTAPVVYVNYGLPPDYAELSRLGVTVRGKIAIARYGKSHRAVKLFTAEQAGAAGLIIYSDPADDGFARGDTWPNGLWRTSQQLQRGNGKYSWYWHGDPLTPNGPAVSGAKRLDPASAPTLPRIPAAVLAWSEARKILAGLGGPVAPAAFRGALPLAYRIGGDDGVRVHMRILMDAGLRPIRDVVAHLRGRIPDRGVLLGTHHDAWTFGGVDPGTGAAAMLEVARALGALAKTGWRPERTISIAFWDAEEFGLIGSTEYAEQRERELREETFCYINTDLYMNGRLDVGGVPSLRDVVADVAGIDVELKALGSGADFVPFQDHVGIPTLSVEFTATGGYTYAAYHSNYDTRLFAERVADPGFRRGVELVQLLGAIALRLADAPVLPFRFSHYTSTMATYVDAAVAWPVDEHALAPLRLAIARADTVARQLERRIDDGLASGALPSANTARLNDVLARLEQRLLDQTEPPERAWYRHVVYGWNIYSLYDGQPFPGLADAVRLHDAARIERDVARLTAAVGRLRAGLEEATRSF